MMENITAVNTQQVNTQTTKAFSVSEENRHYLKVFIQTYHNLPILWDTTLRDYTNRDKRAEAYQQLVPIYKYLKRDATLEDVKKKINTLRTNYRKELKVVEAARKEGNHYQPRCWTFYELDFLRNAEKFLAIGIKNETSSLASPYNVFNDTSSQGHFLDASYGYRMNVGSTSPPPSITEMFHKSFGQQQAIVTQQQKTEQNSNQNTSPLGGGIQNSGTTNTVHYPTPTQHQLPAKAINGNKRLKTASSPPCQSTDQNSQSSPSEMINMACNYLSSTYPEEESIARTWTHKLKRLPREQRLLAEKFINEILFEAESGTLHRGSMQLNAMEPYVRFEEIPTDDSNHDKPQSANVLTETASAQEQQQVLNVTHPKSQVEEENVDTHNSSAATSNDNENSNRSNNNNNNRFNTYN